MKKYSFNSIALIIWILTVYCKVSNGKSVMDRLVKIYKRLDELEEEDQRKGDEIKSLKFEIKELKLKYNRLYDLEREDQKKDLEIKSLKSEIKELKQRTAPKSCAQLSLTGLMNDGKKEWIDPDGRSTGHNPIEVSTLQSIL